MDGRRRHGNVEGVGPYTTPAKVWKPPMSVKDLSPWMVNNCDPTPNKPDTGAGVLECWRDVQQSHERAVARFISLFFTVTYQLFYSDDDLITVHLFLDLKVERKPVFKTEDYNINTGKQLDLDKHLVLKKLMNIIFLVWEDPRFAIYIYQKMIVERREEFKKTGYYFLPYFRKVSVNINPELDMKYTCGHCTAEYEHSTYNRHRPEVNHAVRWNFCQMFNQKEKLRSHDLQYLVPNHKGEDGRSLYETKFQRCALEWWYSTFLMPITKLFLIEWNKAPGLSQVLKEKITPCQLETMQVGIPTLDLFPQELLFQVFEEALNDRRKFEKLSVGTEMTSIFREVSDFDYATIKSMFNQRKKNIPSIDLFKQYWSERSLSRYKKKLPKPSKLVASSERRQQQVKQQSFMASSHNAPFNRLVQPLSMNDANSVFDHRTAPSFAKTTASNFTAVDQHKFQTEPLISHSTQCRQKEQVRFRIPTVSVVSGFQALAVPPQLKQSAANFEKLVLLVSSLIDNNSTEVERSYVSTMTQKFGNIFENYLQHSSALIQLQTEFNINQDSMKEKLEQMLNKKLKRLNKMASQEVILVKSNPHSPRDSLRNNSQQKQNNQEMSQNFNQIQKHQNQSQIQNNNQSQQSFKFGLPQNNFGKQTEGLLVENKQLFRSITEEDLVMDDKQNHDKTPFTFEDLVKSAQGMNFNYLKPHQGKGSQKNNDQQKLRQSSQKRKTRSVSKQEENDRKKQEEEEEKKEKEKWNAEAKDREERALNAAATKTAAKKREADEAAAAKKREADEAAAAKKREAEEAAAKKREAEEAAAKKREAEEAAAKKREAEEAAKKREAEEAAKKREAEEAAAKKREAEEREAAVVREDQLAIETLIKEDEEMQDEINSQGDYEVEYKSNKSYVPLKSSDFQMTTLKDVMKNKRVLNKVMNEFERAFKYCFQTVDFSQIEAMSKQPKVVILLLYKVGNLYSDLQAFVVYKVHEIIDEIRTKSMEMLFIGNSGQTLGAATLLFQFLEQTAIQMKCGDIFAYAEQRALNFYDRNGFINIDEKTVNRQKLNTFEETSKATLKIKKLPLFDVNLSESERATSSFVNTKKYQSTTKPVTRQNQRNRNNKEENNNVNLAQVKKESGSTITDSDTKRERQAKLKEMNKKQETQQMISDQSSPPDDEFSKLVDKVGTKRTRNAQNNEPTNKRQRTDKLYQLVSDQDMDTKKTKVQSIIIVHNKKTSFKMPTHEDLDFQENERKDRLTQDEEVLNKLKAKQAKQKQSQLYNYKSQDNKVVETVLPLSIPPLPTKFDIPPYPTIKQDVKESPKLQPRNRKKNTMLNPQLKKQTRKSSNVTSSNQERKQKPAQKSQVLTQHSPSSSSESSTISIQGHASQIVAKSTSALLQCEVNQLCPPPQQCSQKRTFVIPPYEHQLSKKVKSSQKSNDDACMAIDIKSDMSMKSPTPKPEDDTSGNYANQLRQEAEKSVAEMMQKQRQLFLTCPTKKCAEVQDGGDLEEQHKNQELLTEKGKEILCQKFGFMSETSPEVQGSFCGMGSYGDPFLNPTQTEINKLNRYEELRPKATKLEDKHKEFTLDNDESYTAVNHSWLQPDFVRKAFDEKRIEDHFKQKSTQRLKAHEAFGALQKKLNCKEIYEGGYRFPMQTFFDRNQNKIECKDLSWQNSKGEYDETALSADGRLFDNELFAIQEFNERCRPIDKVIKKWESKHLDWNYDVKFKRLEPYTEFTDERRSKDWNMTLDEAMQKDTFVRDDYEDCFTLKHWLKRISLMFFACRKKFSFCEFGSGNGRSMQIFRNLVVDQVIVNELFENQLSLAKEEAMKLKEGQNQNLYVYDILGNCATDEVWQKLKETEVPPNVILMNWIPEYLPYQSVFELFKKVYDELPMGGFFLCKVNQAIDDDEAEVVEETPLRNYEKTTRRPRQIVRSAFMYLLLLYAVGFREVVIESILENTFTDYSETCELLFVLQKCPYMNSKTAVEGNMEQKKIDFSNVEDEHKKLPKLLKDYQDQNDVKLDLASYQSGQTKEEDYLVGAKFLLWNLTNVAEAQRLYREYQGEKRVFDIIRKELPCYRNLPDEELQENIFHQAKVENLKKQTPEKEQQ